MNPLSAISMFASPQAGGQLPVSLEKLQANIPAAELRTLEGTGAATGLRDALPLGKAAPGQGFGDVLGNFVNEVNGKQAAAADTVNGLMSGEGVSLHQAMIAMEEASVSFQLMVEVRNKLLETYQELMRMQI